MTRRWSDRVKRLVAATVVFAAAAGATTVLGSDGAASRGRWAFVDAAALEDLGLVAHGSRGGSWGMEDHEPATGGRALANHRGEPGARPAVLVAAESRSHDLRARTRCKVVGAPMLAVTRMRSSASCGVVFRFLDDRNHWVVRANTGAGAVEAATVVGGKEYVVARAPMVEAAGMGNWIDLDVEVRGDVVRVALGGRPALVADASTAPAAFGAVGLWAPSEAEVLFDHFAFETLTPAPRALEILPLLGRRSG